MTIMIKADTALANTYLLTVYPGWDWPDLEAAHQAMQRLPNTPLHIIVQIDEPIDMPAGLDLYAKPALERHLQENGGLLIFATRWAMIRSLLHLIRKEFSINLGFVHLCASVDEARALIAQHG
jgi:hypothetical protein